MKHFVLNLRTFKTVVASSESEARNLGNGTIIFNSPEQLAKNPNTTGQVLVRAYNEMSPVQTQKFADKVSGAKRLFRLAQSSAPQNDFYKKFPADEKLAANADKNMELYKEKVLSDNEKPKGGKFTGMVIKCLVNENPRTKKTGHGFNSMQILIDNIKLSGSAAIMSFEDYIAKGGRARDLQWDLDKGHVSVE
jgi:hypothetical protein